MSDIATIGMRPTHNVSSLVGSHSSNNNRISSANHPHRRIRGNRIFINLFIDKIKGLGNFLYNAIAKSLGNFLRSFILPNSKIEKAIFNLQKNLSHLNATYPIKLSLAAESSKHIVKIAKVKPEIEIRKNEIKHLKVKIDKNKNSIIKLGNTLQKYDKIITRAESYPELGMDTTQAKGIAKGTAKKIQILQNKNDEFKDLISEYQGHIQDFNSFISKEKIKQTQHINLITETFKINKLALQSAIMDLSAI